MLAPWSKLEVAHLAQLWSFGPTPVQSGQWQGHVGGVAKKPLQKCNRQLRNGLLTGKPVFLVSKSWLCEKARLYHPACMCSTWYSYHTISDPNTICIPKFHVPRSQQIALSFHVISITPRCLESTCLWLLRGVPVLLTCNQVPLEQSIVNNDIYGQSTNPALTYRPQK